ncbi:formyltetrahydrofolate deformylase [Marinomonas piezotolerans]|uniref:Formyltetrahydrofolate deformylase n=1 Tax=Marinomonas piezotolerans TaxID=2213058 RepID=A0A370U5T9_9GAMM|nr:formyltetrahydrofolate deformylase [Marinomonas piezotolerans]RDL43147.1 formyltetrahydrofolate deformylase [Marinomonas piezotolerans]
MKLKLTPTQNLCVGFLETGFELIQVDDQYYFVKGDRRQKVLSKTLEALVTRGALKHTREGKYELSDEFKQHRKRMRSPVESKHTRH